MRTGKIQLAVRPPPRSFQPSVAAVIDVKTDLPTQDLATLAFRYRSPNQDYSVVDVAVGAHVLRWHENRRPETYFCRTGISIFGIILTPPTER